jgi:6-phosphogluconolactonase
MTEMSTVLKFDDRDAASAAAAERMAGLVRAQLSRGDQAIFVVSGGTTPAKCFDSLSSYSLDWSKVQVALSDERWVPDDHADSNERMLREALLRNEAAAASVLSIYQDNLSVDERCDALQSQLPAAGFACAMVGMGTDGHFASLFPDADSLQDGLNADNSRFYMPVRTTASPHPRISITLGALLKSAEILLLMFGMEKLSVFEKAQAGDDSYPIAALLAQQTVPVELYWAP